MMEKLASRMGRLGTETAFDVLVKAKALEAKGRSVVHLELGEPDFDTPSNVIRAASTAMEEGYTHYCASAGLVELREAIADHVGQTRSVSIDPDWVVVTPGAKPIMFFLILALVEEGDEVIYPNPGFPIYESMIRFCGGTPVPLPLLEDFEFRFDPEQLESKVSSKTKLIIINSPQNPTGGLLTENDLATVADLATRHDITVLSDEIYSCIIYEGEHRSITSIPGMMDRTVILDGFSKTFAMDRVAARIRHHEAGTADPYLKAGDQQRFLHGAFRPAGGAGSIGQRRGRHGFDGSRISQAQGLSGRGAESNTGNELPEPSWSLLRIPQRSLLRQKQRRNCRLSVAGSRCGLALGNSLRSLWRRLPQTLLRNIHGKPCRG